SYGSTHRGVLARGRGCSPPSTVSAKPYTAAIRSSRTFGSARDLCGRRPMRNSLEHGHSVEGDDKALRREMPRTKRFKEFVQRVGGGYAMTLRQSGTACTMALAAALALPSALPCALPARAQPAPPAAAPFPLVEATIDDIQFALRAGRLTARQLVQGYLD